MKQICVFCGSVRVPAADIFRRHNGVIDAPRQALESAGVLTIEMPRNERKTFCCGGGGAQVWKEEEAGTERVNNARFAEAKSTGAGTVAVGCPFCMTMMTDASKADGGTVQVRDVAEIVAERMKSPPRQRPAGEYGTGRSASPCSFN